MPKSVREWVTDRFAIRPIYEHLLDRRVPRASWYTGDGAALLALLGVQVLTGSVLALTYSPSIDSAYESVAYITHDQPWGWFVRGLHYWSAGAMVVMLFFHLFRQLLFGGYKAPREGTWMLGVLLFFCVLLLAYTGYLLRWDERAIYGVRVMLHVLVRVPLIGESLALIVQGGPELGPLTLTRIYAVHVLIIPLITFLLVGLHLYLVIQRGTITRAEREHPPQSAEEQQQQYADEVASSRGERFFPETTYRTGVLAAVVLALVLILTIWLGPGELMPAANLVEPSMPAEEWWFWWFSGLIALLPPSIAPWFVVVLPVVALMGLLLLPLIDRSPARGIRQRPWWTAAVILVIVLFLVLTDYRRRSSFTGWPKDEPPPVPTGMQLTADAEQGRQLFATYGCTSCHPVAGFGRHVAVDLAKLKTPLSREKIREFILQPPEGVAMPSYAGRLTDDELRFLVEFCHVAQTFPRRK